MKLVVIGEFRRPRDTVKSVVLVRVNAIPTNYLSSYTFHRPLPDHIPQLIPK